MDYGQLLRARATGVWTGFHAAGGAVFLGRYETLCGLAEYLECAVEVDPSLAGSNVQGVCHAEEGIIRLRPDLAGAKRLFVLAHEIGHLVLEHPGRIADQHFHLQETVSPTDLEDAELRSVTGLDLPARESAFALRGYDARDRWETEANAFAAELLVPTHRLRAILESGTDWTVSALCRTFGVSQTLVYTQLAACLSMEPSPTQAPAPTTPPTLDAAQEAAASVAAPALIVAGPGSGKTRVLVERFARLVNSGVEPRRILALTFANKAAGEMRERLANLLGDDDRQAAIEVSTFHAFGWQLLREYGHHIGLPAPLRLLTPADALLLMRPHLAGLPLDGFTDLRRPLHKVGELLQMVSRCKDENVMPEAFAQAAHTWQGDPDAAKTARDGAVFYTAYQAVLRENGFVDYGDLVTETLRLFSNPGVGTDIRGRYDHVLVDEFQDINFASGLLVKALGGDTQKVWAVGDPKQSIYGFRGASPVNIAGFKDCYPGATEVSLGINYRSVSGIVQAGQAINVAQVATLPLSAHRAAATSPSVIVAETASMQSEAVYIADEICRLLDSGIPAGEIAVLCRSKSCATPIAAHLSHRGIAHTWGGAIEDRPVFKTLMATLYLASDDLRGIEGLSRLPESLLTEAERRALLQAASRHTGDSGLPSAVALLKAATDGRIKGVGGRAILALQRISRIAERLDADSRPFTNLSCYLFEEAAWFRALFLARNRDTTATREMLATVRQTLMLAARFVERQVARADGDTTSAFLEFVRGSLEADGLGLPSETPHPGSASVNLLTAHRAKGLQWRVVFVPGLAEGRFPTRSQEARDFVFPPGVVHVAHATESPQDAHAREETCLFYVAATRARDTLYLTRARKYPANWQNKPAAVLYAVRDAVRLTGCLAEYVETDAEGAARAMRFESVQSPETLVPTELPNPVSEYALSQYEKCPRRYLYQFVYGLHETDSAYLAFHESVKTAQKQLLYAAQAGATGDSHALLAEVWKQSGPKPAHWYEPFYAQVAHEAVTRFATRIAGSDVSTVRMGESSVVNLPPPDPSGAARRVRVSVDEREIVGSGTVLRRRSFGKPPEKEKRDAENKEVLYALHGAASGTDASVTRSYPRYGRELPVIISAAVMKNRVAKLRTHCDGIESGAFDRKWSDRDCPHCPYTLICNP